jgi:hypothetical protein
MRVSTDLNSNYIHFFGLLLNYLRFTSIKHLPSPPPPPPHTRSNYPNLNMKFFAVSLLAALAAASPIAAPEPNNAELEALVARQLLGGSKDELERGAAGSCPKVILVFARGSTEIGNLVCSAPFHSRLGTFEAQLIHSIPTRFLSAARELTEHVGYSRCTPWRRSGAQIWRQRCLGARRRWPIRRHYWWQPSPTRLAARSHCGDGSSPQDGQHKVPYQQSCRWWLQSGCCSSSSRYH